jgi:hypothetical protein
MRNDNLPELQIIANDQLTFCNKLKQIVNTSGIHALQNQIDIRRFVFVGRSWRLTRFGKDLLLKNFKSYASENDCNKFITGKILLNMDSCCHGPWYVYDNKVITFNETLHFELQMVSGDLNSFVNFKSNR